MTFEISGFCSLLPKEYFRALFLFLLAGVALFTTSSLCCGSALDIAWDDEIFGP